MSLTNQQRENLGKLASYLEQLPPDYEHFGMSNWIDGSAEDVVRYALRNGGVPSCGTVACAVGHGPAAGILVPRSMICDAVPSMNVPRRVDWWRYSAFFAESDSREFEWLFSARWAGCDNTSHGAAARIRYVLDKGSPPASFTVPTPSWCEAYAPYHIEAKAQADA